MSHHVSRVLLAVSISALTLIGATPANAEEICLPGDMNVCIPAEMTCVYGPDIQTFCPAEEAFRATVDNFYRDQDWEWQSPIIEIPIGVDPPQGDFASVVEWSSNLQQNLDNRCSLFLVGVAKYSLYQGLVTTYSYGRSNAWTDCPLNKDPYVTSYVSVTDNGTPFANKYTVDDEDEDDKDQNIVEANAVADQAVNGWGPIFDFHGPGGTITWKFQGSLLLNDGSHAQFCLKADDTIGYADLANEWNYPSVTVC